MLKLLPLLLHGRAHAVPPNKLSPTMFTKRLPPPSLTNTHNTLPQVEANFGCDLAARPFRGDLAGIRAEAQARLYASVLHTAVPWGGKVRRAEWSGLSGREAAGVDSSDSGLPVVAL